MDTVEAAQRLKNGAPFSECLETLEWSRCHPWPVADGLVTRYAETGVVVARARFLSPSVYVASGILSPGLGCCPRRP